MEEQVKENLNKLLGEQEGENSMSSKVDRVANWDAFSAEVRDYIGRFTVEKYGSSGEDKEEFDLMSITEPRIAVWNVFKYVWRLWNKRGKRNDIYKIVHYAEIAWTQAGGMKGDLESLGIIGEEKSG